jgi:hypothetical protein
MGGNPRLLILRQKCFRTGYSTVGQAHKNRSIHNIT